VRAFVHGEREHHDEQVEREQANEQQRLAKHGRQTSICLW
jgi:hypothetical protein